MAKLQVTEEVLGEAENDLTLERLAQAHHDFLLALAHKLCRTYFDPEDLVQDVLLKTVAHFDRLPPGINHRAWMTQVMKNLFTDQLRRWKTRTTLDPANLLVNPDELPWWHDLDAEAVREAAGRLPDELREAFDRFVFRGESYETIAEALAIPRPTVGTRILRARRRIKALLIEKRGAS
jgi:RNA polymerase sigma-70 factor (ECF subfamily)